MMDKKRADAVKGVAVAVILLMGFFYCRSVFKSDPDKPKPDTDLHGSVQLTGGQFIITNKDAFDWTDVKLEINGGYVLRQPKISAGQTYQVGAMQFANSDALRFNPLSMKAQSLIICGNTPNGPNCNIWHFN